MGSVHAMRACRQLQVRIYDNDDLKEYLRPCYQKAQASEIYASGPFLLSADETIRMTLLHKEVCLIRGRTASAPAVMVRYTRRNQNKYAREQTMLTHTFVAAASMISPASSG